MEAATCININQICSDGMCVSSAVAEGGSLPFEVGTVAGQGIWNCCLCV